MLIQGKGQPSGEGAAGGFSSGCEREIILMTDISHPQLPLVLLHWLLLRALISGGDAPFRLKFVIGGYYLAE